MVIVAYLLPSYKCFFVKTTINLYIIQNDLVQFVQNDEEKGSLREWHKSGKVFLKKLHGKT